MQSGLARVAGQVESICRAKANKITTGLPTFKSYTKTEETWPTGREQVSRMLRHGQEGPGWRRPGRYLPVAQVGWGHRCTEPCNVAACEGFKEGPGWVPYSATLSKTLLLRPGNILG